MSGSARAEALDGAATRAAWERALDRLLTGVHPFAGDPFQRRENLDVAGEELLVWSEDFPRRLRRASGRDTVLVLRTERAEDDRIEVLDGWAVPLHVEGRTWWEVAGAIELVVNGLEFVILDGAASWAVVVLPDAQLVAGDQEFIRAYFGSELDAAEAGAVFRSLVDDPDAFEEFRRLGDYVRVSASPPGGGPTPGAAASGPGSPPG